MNAACVESLLAAVGDEGAVSPIVVVESFVVLVEHKCQSHTDKEQQSDQFCGCSSQCHQRSTTSPVDTVVQVGLRHNQCVLDGSHQASGMWNVQFLNANLQMLQEHKGHVVEAIDEIARLLGSLVMGRAGQSQRLDSHQHVRWHHHNI